MKTGSTRQSDLMEKLPNFEFILVALVHVFLYNHKCIVHSLLFLQIIKEFTYTCRIKINEGSATDIMAQDKNLSTAEKATKKEQEQI